MGNDAQTQDRQKKYEYWLHIKKTAAIILLVFHGLIFLLSATLLTIADLYGFPASGISEPAHLAFLLIHGPLSAIIIIGVICVLLNKSWSKFVGVFVFLLNLPLLPLSTILGIILMVALVKTWIEPTLSR